MLTLSYDNLFISLVYIEHLNIPNYIIINHFTGGNYDDDDYDYFDYDEITNFNSILRYDPTKESWEEEGQMMEARSSHAVSVLEDVSLLCP